MNKNLLMLLLPVLISSGCDKDPGEGGNSVIKGQIIERAYQVYPIRYTEQGAQEEDVYIIFGDSDNAFDERTRTSFDGSYKFETLKKGSYRIFVYTEDTAATNFGNKTQVILKTEIKKNRSENQVPTITIINL